MGELQQPYIAGIDPDETKSEAQRREKDYGSEHHAANRIQKERARIAAEKKARRIVSDETTPPSPPRLQSVKPLINIYLRGIRPSADEIDATAIHALAQSHSALPTALPVTEFDTIPNLTNLLYFCADFHFPFLLAFSPSPSKPTSSTHHHRGSDTLLGFAYAVPFPIDEPVNDPNHDNRDPRFGVYGDTRQIRILVRDDVRMKSVGSALLDQLLARMDATYKPRGGYNVEDKKSVDKQALGVKEVLLHVPYEDVEKWEWVGQWLAEGFEFEKVGDLKGVGTWEGKKVGIATFQRSSTAEADRAESPNGNQKNSAAA